MWHIWQDYSDEMRCGHKFNMVAAIMEGPTAKAWMNSVNVVTIPVNAPPQVAQNIIATAAHNSAAIVAHPPIQLNELIASIESTRYAVAVHTTFSIIRYPSETHLAAVHLRLVDLAVLDHPHEGAVVHLRDLIAYHQRGHDQVEQQNHQQGDAIVIERRSLWRFDFFHWNISCLRGICQGKKLLITLL